MQIDQKTLEKKYGYYAIILVEVDLSGTLPNLIRVELPDYGFNVEIHYENLPSKCTVYYRYGHSANNCRLTMGKQIIDDNHNKKPMEPKQVYRPVSKNQNEVVQKDNKTAAVVGKEPIGINELVDDLKANGKVEVVDSNRDREKTAENIANKQHTVKEVMNERKSPKASADEEVSALENSMDSEPQSQISNSLGTEQEIN